MNSRKIRKAASVLMLATALSVTTVSVSGCSLIRAVNSVTSIFSGNKKTSTAKKIKRAKKVISMIGTILGQFNKTTTASSLVGTWNYKMPAVQFENENYLTKAGGVQTGQAVSDNLAPILEKIGLKEGSLALTLKKNGTAVYKIGNKSINGTYTYDDDAKKLVLKYGLISLPAAYLSVADNQMAMTFDASNLTSMVQAAGLVGNKSSVKAVSNLANSYDGMKTGLSFVKAGK